MVATAPDASCHRCRQGWLDSFLAEWQTGTGETREVHEPATGRFLLTVRQSTPQDVARAAAAAAAAPTGVGSRRATRNAPRSCAARPTSTSAPR